MPGPPISIFSYVVVFVRSDWFLNMMKWQKTASHYVIMHDKYLFYSTQSVEIILNSANVWLFFFCIYWYIGWGGVLKQKFPLCHKKGCEQTRKLEGGETEWAYKVKSMQKLWWQEKAKIHLLRQQYISKISFESPLFCKISFQGE